MSVHNRHLRIEVTQVTDLPSLLESSRPLLVPGAANALTARVIEDLGFGALYLSGAGIANTSLGLPDIGLLTLGELAQHVENVRDVTSIPIVVDSDTGFGNPIGVRRTVRKLERAGAAAVQLEDQYEPKKCGHFDGKAVIPAADMVHKIHAALDARSSDEFLVIARTDARAVEGLDEAIERAHRYSQAGADLIFVEAPRSQAEMRRITNEVPARHVANMVEGGMTPLESLAALQDMGFAMVLYANTAMRAAVSAMQSSLLHLRDVGDTREIVPQLISWDERQRLVAKPYYDDLEARYGGAIDTVRTV